MRHTILSAAFVLVTSLALPTGATEIVDFHDVVLPSEGYLDAKSDASSGGFASGPAWFHWTYDSTWDIASGFALSEISDPQSYQGQEPWNHPYNAITGSGFGGAGAYAVANVSPTALVDIPADPLSIAVTNTTYAYYSMLEGDAFGKKFGGDSGEDPDWFRLSITGLDIAGKVVGEVETMLADFLSDQSSQDYILDSWRTVDLTSLAGARQLQFQLESSDNSEFGMNTPAYVAVDQLVIVPEPAGLLLAIAALAALMAKKRTRVSAGTRLG